MPVDSFRFFASGAQFSSIFSISNNYELQFCFHVIWVDNLLLTGNCIVIKVHIQTIGILVSEKSDLQSTLAQLQKKFKTKDSKCDLLKHK